MSQVTQNNQPIVTKKAFVNKNGTTVMFTKATMENAKKESDALVADFQTIEHVKVESEFRENYYGYYKQIVISEVWNVFCAFKRMSIRTVSHPKRSFTFKLLIHDIHYDNVIDLFSQGFYADLDFNLEAEDFNHNGNVHTNLTVEINEEVSLIDLYKFGLDIVNKTNVELKLQNSELLHEMRAEDAFKPSTNVSKKTDSLSPADFPALSENIRAASPIAPTPAPTPAPVDVAPAPIPAPVAVPVTLTPVEVAPAPVPVAIAPVASIPVNLFPQNPSDVTPEAIANQEKTIEKISAQITKLQKELTFEKENLLIMHDIVKAQECARKSLAQIQSRKISQQAAAAAAESWVEIANEE